MACYDGNDYLQAEETRADGVKIAADIRLAQAAILAILNAKDLVDNYKKQHKIADRAMKNAEEQQKHLRDVFWPRELDFLKEFGDEQDIEEAGVKGRRHAGRLVSTVANAFAQEMRKLDCNAPRHCTSNRSKRVQDLLIMRSQAMTNARIMGRIMGFLDVQRKRDRNFDRRLQASALGAGLLQTAAKLRKSASEGLEGIGQALSQQLNSAFELFGSGLQQRTQSLDRIGALTTATGQLSNNPVQRSNSLKASGNLGPNYSNFEIGLVQRDANGMPIGLSSDIIRGFDNQNSFNSTDAAIDNQMDYGDRSLMFGTSPHQFLSLQSENNNDGRISDRDLVRTGKVTFFDSDGNSVVVDMDQFPMTWADGNKKGDIIPQG